VQTSFWQIHKFLSKSTCKISHLYQLNNLNHNLNKTYRYHSNGRRIVPACHKLWASNVHQTGGKSPSSSKSKTRTDIIVAAAFHTYGCCRCTRHDQISHAAALVNPVKLTTYGNMTCFKTVRKLW